MKKNVIDILLICLLSFNFLLLDFYFHLPEKRAVIYILDVGQGDSILIKTIDDKYILIDSGPDKKAIYQLQKIIPFWRRKLDLVILTHPDKDHVGGLPDILEYYDVNLFLFNEIEHDNKEYNQVLSIIEEYDIVTSIVDEYSDYQIGCCSYIDTLWPTQNFKKDFYESQSVDTNSISTAFVLMIDGLQMYFGGDLEAQYEERIFETNEYDLDVIKVGHHGSKSSTSRKFLQLTNPEIAVISVGKNNKFSHPSTEVLQNLETLNILIERTDQSGAIKVYPDEF